MSDLERGDDLGLVREAAFALLREDQPVIEEDVELTCPAGRNRGGLVGALVDRGRETRGPGVVPASGGAVDDLDGHRSNLPSVPDDVPQNADPLDLELDDVARPEPAGVAVLEDAPGSDRPGAEHVTRLEARVPRRVGADRVP